MPFHVFEYSRRVSLFPVLSVLIATLPVRKMMFDRLTANLRLQITPPARTSIVEVLADDLVEGTIGAKRNRLLFKARGTYVVFIDDDDNVPDLYIEKILNAVDSFPDVVGFVLHQMIRYNLAAVCYHSLQVEFWEDYSRDGQQYRRRTPTHLNPIRSDLASQARFPDISQGEDHEFMRQVMPLLKTEYFIDDCMYYYLEHEKKVLDQLR